ncbi:lysylphosphatidylglycerol synthase transmembrane domain-containing protein [Cohnella suwonensis]|uniref:Phosphatidylglycerol lysyltransferase n=1 Tax=Cohnella suwonensis TaxID=696072 RepID=A0ABW0M1M3_9BACL
MTTKKLIKALAWAIFLLFLLLVWRWFDPRELFRQFGMLARHPDWLFAMFVAYWLSFVLKAYAWRTYAGTGGGIGLYYHGLMYSLLVNHLLPVKVGDLVRVGVMMRGTRASWDDAFHSVAVMRLLDMLVLGAISVAGAMWLGLSATWIGVGGLLAIAVVAAIGHNIEALRRIPFIGKHLEVFGKTFASGKGLIVIALVGLSWVLEAGVIYGVVRMSGLSEGAASLVWANSVTIAGQVFHIAPGGIGTYETTLSGALSALGVSGEAAFAAALLSHGFKFAFAYAAGCYSVLRMPVGWREATEWMRRKQPFGESKPS